MGDDVEEPLFHPNVKPETGFVCLWQEANPRDTAVQALALDESPVTPIRKKPRSSIRI